MAKSAINVVIRIISVLVVGMWVRAKDAGVIEQNLMAGVERNVTDPVEAGTPDPGQGHGHNQAMN